MSFKMDFTSYANDAETADAMSDVVSELFKVQINEEILKDVSCWLSAHDGKSWPHQKEDLLLHVSFFWTDFYHTCSMNDLIDEVIEKDSEYVETMKNILKRALTKLDEVSK